MLSTFFRALKCFWKDKVLVFLSLFPILLGGTIYYFFGKWMYTTLFDWAKTEILSSVGDNILGTSLSWLVAGFFSVILFFLITWTFVFVVSFIASPFNDYISLRVARLYSGENTSFGFENLSFFKRYKRVFLNELKKAVLLLIVGFIAFVIGFFPFLSLITFILSAFLLAWTFLDYSWSRDELSLSSSLKDLLSSWMTNLFSGLFFLFLLAIPVLNLFFLPYAVVYFTWLYCRRNKEITH